MAEELTRWQKFKRFLKRNMTPTWAKHFCYQVFAFLVSVAMILGVAGYAVTKSYDERTLNFTEGFTITAHTGAFETQENSIEFVRAAIEHKVAVIELDIRQRPNGTESIDVDAVKNSACADMDYYLNCQPSRIKIFADDYSQKLLNTLKESGAIGVNCNYQYAGGRLSELLHKNGYKLSVWTVNDEYAMKRALMFEPDNITTKQYDLLVSTINNWGK